MYTNPLTFVLVCKASTLTILCPIVAGLVSKTFKLVDPLFETYRTCASASYSGNKTPEETPSKASVNSKSAPP